MEEHQRIDAEVHFSTSEGRNNILYSSILYKLQHVLMNISTKYHKNKEQPITNTCKNNIQSCLAGV